MLRSLRRRTYRARRVWHEVTLALRRPFRLLVALGILGLAGIGVYALATAPLEERIGGGVDLGPDSTAVLDFSEHSDLAWTDLESGDRLVAVAGEPVTPERAAELAERSPFGEGLVGDTLAVRVERDGAVVEASAVYGAGEIEQARRLGLSHRGVEGVLRALLVFVIVMFCLGGLVLLVRSQGRGYQASLATALLTAAGGFAFIALAEHAGRPSNVLVALAITASLFVFLGAMPTVNGALIRFPDGRHSPRWTRYVRGVSVAAVGAIFIVGVAGIVWEAKTGRDVGFFVPMFQVVIAALLVLPVVGLVQKYRRATDTVVRQQMKWVLLPVAVFAVATVLYFVLSPVDRLHAHNGPVGYVITLGVAVLWRVAVAAVPLGVLAGVFQFRPWDADLWIARSAAVGAGTLGLAAAFAGGAEAIRLGLRSSFGDGAEPAAAALAAVVSLFAFNPVREWATRRFERDLERTREILGERLPLVLAGRQVVASPAEIGRVAIRAVRDALQTDRAAVLDLDPGGWEAVATEGVEPADALAWAGATLAPSSLPACAEQVWEDPVFVLRVPLYSAEDELVGVLALGTHGKGRGYSTEERKALDAVSRPLAEALRVAERREEAAARDRQRLARIVGHLLDDPETSGDGAAPTLRPAP